MSFVHLSLTWSWLSHSRKCVHFYKSIGNSGLIFGLITYYFLSFQEPCHFFHEPAVVCFPTTTWKICTHFMNMNMIRKDRQDSLGWKKSSPWCMSTKDQKKGGEKLDFAHNLELYWRENLSLVTRVSWTTFLLSRGVLNMQLNNEMCNFHYKLFNVLFLKTWQ